MPTEHYCPHQRDELQQQLRRHHSEQQPGLQYQCLDQHQPFSVRDEREHAAGSGDRFRHVHLGRSGRVDHHYADVSGRAVPQFLLHQLGHDYRRQQRRACVDAGLALYPDHVRQRCPGRPAEYGLRSYGLSRFHCAVPIGVASCVGAGRPVQRQRPPASRHTGAGYRIRSQRR